MDWVRGMRENERTQGKAPLSLLEQRWSCDQPRWRPQWLEQALGTLRLWPGAY